MSSDPPKARVGLSLYANLLDPGSKDTSGATISSAPVVYKQPGGTEARPDDVAAQKQQLNNAALRFQPTKRPQAATQKKAIPAKFATAPAPAAPAPSAPTESRTTSQLPKSNLEDWTGDADEDEFYGSMQRQRGGRKRRKKNKEQGPVAQDWDDIYDPSRPNSYDEYKHSEEKFRELREWKDRLYAHRAARRRSPSTDSDDAPRRPAFQFAPPPAEGPPPPPESDEYQPPPPPTMDISQDVTGGDAFVRRMRLSQASSVANENVAMQGNVHLSNTTEQTRPAPITNQYAPVMPPSTISRAPVRYSLPNAPDELPKSEAELESALAAEEQAEDEGPIDEEKPRSIRPGQKGFAERLMAKYGWSKGSGLGAQASGIITPLQAKLEKQKKKPDSEGGGFAGPGGMGKITGGKRKGGEQEGMFGRMSEVVVLRRMLDGIDLQYELEEGNLLQEIGEECGEKYGRVERVYVDRSATDSPPVFIKFTSQLSALRAVNALEGRVFNGNTINARFFDSEKFDNGVYQ